MREKNKILRKNKIFIIYIMAGTRCKKKTRRCVDGKCYYIKSRRKKTAKKRCPKGSRKCKDNKCHKKN